MDRGRLRFFLALSLFMGWVIGLSAMAFFSADRPQERPSAPAAR